MTWRNVLVRLRRGDYSRGAAPNRSRAPRPGPAPDSRKWCSPPRTSPQGVQYDRITREPGQADGAGAPPAMLSRPEGCSDGLTRVIADSAERGPGSAAEYLGRL